MSMEEISLMTTTIDSTQLQNDKIESKSIFRWDWTLTMHMEHEKFLEIVFHSNAQIEPTLLWHGQAALMPIVLKE